jgi:nucleoside-diphosphate-sugar epimerase
VKKVKVGVLGANGQIGPVVLRRLAESEAILPVAICRNSVGAALIDDIGCDVRLGSITDESEAKRLLDDCSVVLNCIWPVVPSKEVKPLNEIIIRNLSRLKCLKRVIHLSSVAVYGCIHEGSTFRRPRPDSSYGVEKVQTERFVSRVFSNTSTEYYVIRLGHVFGTHQWLTRDVIELTLAGNFRLPFNGDCPSNAIHVDDVASALTWLISASLPSGVYNLAASPHLTWRQIFDWHSRICGLPAVKAMSPEDSQLLRASYIRSSQRPAPMRVLAEIFGWLKCLPLQQLASSTNFRGVASNVLGMLPRRIRTRIKAGRTLGQTRREINALAMLPITPAPWFYSDGMPGQYLEPPQTTHIESLNRRERDILDWFRAKSGPQWFFSDAEEGLTASAKNEMRMGV